MQHTKEEKLEALGRLIDTLDVLRVKCPWDAKQTNESLRPNTVEEVFELTQALLDDDANEIKKELGDVLLHVLFYSKIASESDRLPSTTSSFSATPTCSARSRPTMPRPCRATGSR